MPRDLAPKVTPGSRVIDVGAKDGSAARQWIDHGHRYLGLVPAGRLEAVRDSAGELSGRFHELRSQDQVTGNNADILILREPFARHLWNAPELRYTRLVLVERWPGRRALAETLTASGVGIASGLRYRGRYAFGGTTFAAFETTRRRPLGPRHYLSEITGVSGFIQQLEEANVTYAVLRWFETLPRLLPGEDLDMLVADDDVRTVADLLAGEPGTVSVDMYSATGLPGSEYRSVAYYQPDLAAKILAGAVRHTSGCHVPGPEDHLHSLCYHALYHKGFRSGLPSTTRTGTVPDPEHDYGATLQQLAGEIGISLPETLEGIDDYLETAGWRPSQDALRRLSLHNPWLFEHLMSSAAAPGAAAEPPEPAVFLVRERTLDVLSPDQVTSILADLGFDVLLVQELDSAARERCLRRVRGGNWGRGPFPVSGGAPAIAVVAAHYGPRTPPPETAARYPGLTNDDVLAAKLAIRSAVEELVAESQRFNPVHSADNAAEAWEYVELALPDHETRLRAEFDQRRAAYRTGPSVLRTLSRGRRAKVEVVDHGAGPVVRKTFAPRFVRHLDRELVAMRELAPSVPAVATLLDAGPNWFEQPLYRNALDFDRDRGRLVPLRVVRQMVDVLRQFHVQGVDLIDVKPENFVLDPVHGLRIIDFEFLHRYDGAPPPFAASYGFVGPPPGFAGDVPVSNLSYRWRWLPFTGLPLKQLLDGSPASQHVHRTIYRVTRRIRGPRGVLPAGRRVGGKTFRWSRRTLAGWGRRRAARRFERLTG